MKNANELSKKLPIHSEENFQGYTFMIEKNGIERGALEEWVSKSKYTKHPIITEMGKCVIDGETFVWYHDWSFEFYINGNGKIILDVKVFNPNFHKFVKMVFTNERVVKNLAQYLISHKQPSKFFEILRNYKSGEEKRLMKKILKIFIKYNALKVEGEEVLDFETKKQVNVAASEEAEEAMVLHFDEQTRLIEVLEKTKGSSDPKVVIDADE
jgi:hypothetical protein